MTDMMQGLSISIIGILITFFALGVFILVMVVLQRIFPAASNQTEKTETPEEPSLEVEYSQQDFSENDDQAVVAAIAVAMDYFRKTEKSVLGANLEAGRGPWWTVNRLSVRQISTSRKN